MASSPYPPDWRRRRVVVFARDGHVCRYCGQYANTVDHVVAMVDGGTHDLANLVACCGACNSRKSMERNRAARARAGTWGVAAGWVAARGASHRRPRPPSGALANPGGTGAPTTNQTA